MVKTPQYITISHHASCYAHLLPGTNVTRGIREITELRFVEPPNYLSLDVLPLKLD